ncbi:hypothetical protein CSV60_04095 [Sporosarcina sp. P7]|nr:hypothetical protein CSV60_04095 [Sporosarcina sp. P7]
MNQTTRVEGTGYRKYEDRFVNLIQSLQWNMYSAKTAGGLCYIGSRNTAFNEVDMRNKKHVTDYHLVEN